MEDQKVIVIFIGMGCLMMLILALVIILFYQHYRSNLLKLEKEKHIMAFKAAVEAEEKQKERIANNLHDEVLPLLLVIRQSIDRHIRNYDRHKIEKESLKTNSELIDQSISEIKAITLDLIPKVLLSFGLIKGLEQYIRQMNSSGVHITELKNKTTFTSEVPFSKSDQVNIYRICLEILNNLQKHAGFTNLTVIIDSRASSLLIEFWHNGKRVSNEDIEMFSEFTMGLGLKSLQSRLLMLNATIHYSKETQAAAIDLNIPFSL
jgi:signal transduction histidine kinase